LSNQYYLELSIVNTEYNLYVNDIISVIRLSDNKELWNSDHPGTIAVATSGNYQLIFSSSYNPSLADRVLAIYYSNDIRQCQPFTFNNYIIKSRVDTLTTDISTGKLTIPLTRFVNQASNLPFTVIEPNTDIALFTVTDGYLVQGSIPYNTATVSSYTVNNFSSQVDLLHKKVKILGAANINNDGIYDITSYDIPNNLIGITKSLTKLNTNQISIIRLLDGKEIWNSTGTIDATNNKILLPSNVGAAYGDKVVVIIFNYTSLRKSPTRLAATITDQTTNPGVITVIGNTITKAEDIIFTVTSTGLKLNLYEAVSKSLGLSSTATIPSNIKLAKIVKAEKVVTYTSTSSEVLSVLTTYDVKNTALKNNLYYSDEMLLNTSLSNLECVLPSTANNLLNLGTHNLPAQGDKIRITFYYTTEADSENLYYTRNGVLYTNKKFALINRIFVSSGFRSSQSTSLTFSTFTQPGIGSRYKIVYDYLAPKQNERIVVRYNYNKLISDVTFNVENTRPINADVLVRGAKLVLLDLTINVVIADSYKTSTQNVIQNLRDQLVSAMTATALGTIIDAPTLINVAQAVAGIARARILYFNKTGAVGQISSIQMQKDEYFASNQIIINTETR